VVPGISVTILQIVTKLMMELIDSTKNIDKYHREFDHIQTSEDVPLDMDH